MKNINESSLSRIWEHSQNHSIGIITANRAENTGLENKKRNLQLLFEIRKNGFGVIKVKGHGIENQGTKDEVKIDENSFFVISEKDDGGKLKGFLKKMGTKFGQDAILYKAGNSNKAILIGTRSGAFPGLGAEKDLGAWRPNKIGDYYTTWRNRPFIFESVEYEESLIVKSIKTRK